MEFEDLHVDEWLKKIDAYFGRGEPRPIGRPKHSINKDLICMLKAEGYSNRRIAKELGLSNRTVDRRVRDLYKEGRLTYVGFPTKRNYENPDKRQEIDSRYPGYVEDI